MPHQDIGVLAGQVAQVPGKLTLKIFQLLQGEQQRGSWLVSPTSATAPHRPSRSCAKSQTGDRSQQSQSPHFLSTSYVSGLVLCALSDFNVSLSTALHVLEGRSRSLLQGVTAWKSALLGAFSLETEVFSLHPLVLFLKS